MVFPPAEAEHNFSEAECYHESRWHKKVTAYRKQGERVSAMDCCCVMDGEKEEMRPWETENIVQHVQLQPNTSVIWCTNVIQLQNYMAGNFKRHQSFALSVNARSVFSLWQLGRFFSQRFLNIQGVQITSRCRDARVTCFPATHATSATVQNLPLHHRCQQL